MHHIFICRHFVKDIFLELSQGDYCLYIFILFKFSVDLIWAPISQGYPLFGASKDLLSTGHGLQVFCGQGIKLIISVVTSITMVKDFFIKFSTEFNMFHYLTYLGELNFSCHLKSKTKVYYF